MTRLLKHKNAPNPDTIAFHKTIDIDNNSMSITQTSEPMINMNDIKTQINFAPVLTFKGTFDEKTGLPKTGNYGEILYSKDSGKTYIYVDHWELLGDGNSVEEGTRYNKHMIPYPVKCKCCGASMHDYICEYCGTEYPKYVIEE